jgi:hypothetical protein
MAGIIERIRPTLKPTLKEDLSEAFFGLQSECFIRNQQFLEKAREFSIPQELTRLAEENKGTITPFLPLQAQVIEKKHKVYQIQINTPEGLVIKELKNKSDFSQVLAIPQEKLVISWDVSWDNFKLIRVEMDGNFRDLKIFGGPAALRLPKVPENPSAYGNRYSSLLSLSDEDFQSKFSEELKKASKNPWWSLASLAGIYPTPLWVAKF